MSTNRRPRKPPRRVYMVRRAVVLVALLLVVWLIAMGVRAVLSSDDDSSATPSDGQTTGETDGDEEPEPSPEPEPEPEPEPDFLVRVASEPGLCDPRQVSIVPSIATQDAGGPIRMHFSLTTREDTACTLELEPDDVIARIQRGDSTIWDAARCNTPVIEQPVSLAPGWVTNVSVEWNGRVSGSSCGDQESFADSGRHVLQIATLGGDPGRVSFTLNDPPPDEEDEEDDDSEEESDD